MKDLLCPDGYKKLCELPGDTVESMDEAKYHIYKHHGDRASREARYHFNYRDNCWRVYVPKENA
jgi:hypothetical protein